MKKCSKSKSTSTSKKIEPDIAGFMVKVQEQLAALAAKIDAWTGQGSAGSFEKKETLTSAPQESLLPKSSQQPVSVKSALQSNAQQRQGEARHPRGRRERPLYKAVCADCQQDCEIPFKPSGERPVYCKPCFSKRKTNQSPKVENIPSPSVNIVVQAPEKVDRRVVVTKKGVGKVTVSEIVRPVTRAFPSRDKSQKPAQSPKK